MIYRFSILLLLIAFGCNTDEPEPIPRYTFENRSGHVVSIAYLTQYNPEYNPDPKIDSLVFPDGERFTIRSNSDVSSAFEPHASGNIYYDGRYKIAANKLLEKRKLDMHWAWEYVISEDEESLYMDYIYIFTETDYTYDVENGTDLNAEQ